MDVSCMYVHIYVYVAAEDTVILQEQVAKQIQQ